MSKDARKIRNVNRHVKHEAPKPVAISPEKQKKIKKIAILVLIGILAGIPFFMGKYCEFNQPDAYDSGCYTYSAKHIIEGAKLGVEEIPSAKVGTLLVNIIGVRLFGFSETGPKIIQMLLQASALTFMFYVMLQLYGTLPAAIGVIIASIYISAPIISKAGNVKEQYMIACMILGISFFVLGQLRGKWVYTMLAGGFVSLGPLFKETGLSAIGAIGLFVLVQPLLKHVTWKNTGKDILLLLAGVFIFVTPINLWLLVHKSPGYYYPYAAFWMPMIQHFSGPDDNPAQTPEVTTEDVNNETVASAENDNSSEPGLFLRMMPPYVRDSWMIMSAEQRQMAFDRVFRWYRVLILPILLALGSIFIRLFRVFLNLKKNPEEKITTVSDRFVFLFTIWWLLDMGFIFISPRSYEQYYLPLNASAAMLGGYIIMVYREKLKNHAFRPFWIGGGFAGLVLMIVLVWHIFFGVWSSAFSGGPYLDGNRNPEKRNGYVQRLKEASAHRKGVRYGWENIGEYIRLNTTDKDGIYVWGWYPGIYVAAQRLSPAPKAFESNMHTLSPEVLEGRIKDILNAFKNKPPKFVVDSRKPHFPWDGRLLELWPVNDNGELVGTDPQAVTTWDMRQEIIISQKYGQDELLRYRAMKQFRTYIRNNYIPIVRREFGSHILFKRKES
ncbi:MAG: glycosyltransferase family 39 protein [Sedimentisphaerales bacterium]|nr:glycosyltransferase family 39 protein [Sedimentisphaerales bacterium]